MCNVSRGSCWIGVVVLTAIVFAALASGAAAHPGHSHGDGRIPGFPDFKRVGDEVFRFHPEKGLYSHKRPGGKPSWFHADFPPAAEGFTYDLPTSEEPVVCATSGHRIRVVYSSTANPATPTTTQINGIRSIVRRMNWKIVYEAVRSSGGARALRMRVDCDAGGQIKIYTLTAQSGYIYDIWTADNSLGEPTGANAVKNLIFFDGADPFGAWGYGDALNDSLKSSSDASTGNDNRIRTTSATVYNHPDIPGFDIWKTHTALHEFFHAMGAVQPTAPFATSRYHCTDGIDTMCYADDSAQGPSYSETRCPTNGFYDTSPGVPLDCAYDSYFDAAEESGEWLNTHWNTGGIENPYLVKSPQVQLKYANAAGPADLAFPYGSPGDKPVFGDWDEDGDDTIGVRRNGDFYLSNSNSGGVPQIIFSFGNPGDLPVAGDWNGDGVDSIGVYRPTTGDFYLRDQNTGGPSQYSFSFGNSGDVPVAGDWNGDGIDSIGVFRPTTGDFYLSNNNGPGPPDYAFSYGNAGDRPVAGDWAGDGADRIGVYRPSNGVWYLERYSLSTSSPEWVFAWGNASYTPITGDWDNNGTDTPGLFE
jgi:hypothetical protein